MSTLVNDRDRQLFTDITPAEASIIEGGRKIFLSHIQALRLTKDEKDGRDEPYILANGRNIWAAKGGMKVGDTRRIGKFVSSPLRWFANIQLWENDGFGRLSDDFIGQLPVTPWMPKGKKVATLTGSGAKYKLFYSVR